MKEISAAALISKAFPADSLKSAKPGRTAKTAGASFDSFLGDSSRGPAVQSQTDNTQFKANAAQSQPSRQQLKTDTPQQTEESTNQDTVQNGTVSQTDAAQDTQQTDSSATTDGTVKTDGDAQAAVTDEPITEEEAVFNEVITAVNQMIRDIIKDATGIDDEMLNSALSALGLSETDLLDTANLAKLVLMLNGSSDTTDLLTNEYMMSQFNDISDALADTSWEAVTGMSREEFIQVLENVADKSVAADDVTAGMPQNTDMQSGAGQTENCVPVVVEYADDEGMAAELRQTAGTETVSAAAKETAATDIPAKQTDSSVSGDSGLPAGRENQSVNTDSNAGQPDGFNQDTGSQTDSTLAESTQTETRTPVHNEIFNGTAGFLQNLSQAVADVAGETVPQQANMQQMIDIVNQVVEQIKVTLGKETTSMQMQLNPESLGKVLISVSSNHGVMTANFTVQTEEAKEALQSQMYNLREALESRSLKVDAVEVEVSDFAFSQSSQADAQDQKEFGRGNGKRFRFSFEDSSGDGDIATDTVQNKSSQAGPGLGSSIDFTA